MKVMACVLKRYTGLVFAALAAAGCTEEVKQAEGNASIEIVTPSGENTVFIKDNKEEAFTEFTLKIVSKVENWDFSISESATEWCQCDKVSSTELAVRVSCQKNRHPDRLKFDSRSAVIEVFATNKPEIKASCKIVQSAFQPDIRRVDFPQGESETEIEVSKNGEPYYLAIDSDIPVLYSTNDSRVEISVDRLEKEESWDGVHYKGDVFVGIPRNEEAETKVTEVKLYNTVTIDGTEKEISKTFRFIQGAQNFICKLVNPSEGPIYYGGTSFEVEVVSPADWSINNDETYASQFATFSPSSGKAGKTVVRVDVPANMDDRYKTVSCVVSCMDKELYLPRLQQEPFAGIKYTTNKYRTKLSIAETPMKVSNHIISDYEGRIATKEPLLEIPVGQFNNCKDLVSITLPASVKSIGNTAFSECTSLESITMNDEMETMGGSIFYNCISLRSVKWPKVKDKNEVPNNTFYNCKSLSSFYGPEGLSRVGDYAFYYCPLSETGFDFSTVANDFTLGKGAFACSSLSSVRLPENLTLIPASAFIDCKSLTSVEMGDSVLEIGDSAFNGCENLTTISWSANLESIGSYAFAFTSIVHFWLPGNVTTIDYAMLFGCKKTLSVEMHRTKITYLPESVFENCSSLTTVRLPATIVKMHDFCFSGVNLHELYVQSDIPPTFTELCDPYFNSLRANRENVRVYVPSASFDKYLKADIWKELKLYKCDFVN